MKNGQILNHLQAIESLKEIKLGGTISLALIKNKKKLIDAYKLIEELRVELCDKSADKDENGSPKKDGDKYIFSEENEIQLNKDFAEILEKESDIELVKFNDKILEQFSDITPYQIEALSLFIKE
jgi:hypothetical protein